MPSARMPSARMPSARIPSARMPSPPARFRDLNERYQFDNLISERYNVERNMPDIYLATGRSADEIRNYLINECGFSVDIVGNIPEVVASSSRSSYRYALESIMVAGEDDPDEAEWFLTPD
jgi:hypothetical protein